MSARCVGVWPGGGSAGAQLVQPAALLWTLLPRSERPRRGPNPWTWTSRPPALGSSRPSPASPPGPLQRCPTYGNTQISFQRLLGCKPGKISVGISLLSFFKFQTFTKCQLKNWQNKTSEVFSQADAALRLALHQRNGQCMYRAVFHLPLRSPLRAKQ